MRHDQAFFHRQENNGGIVAVINAIIQGFLHVSQFAVGFIPVCNLRHRMQLS